jgi:hypothetical protein
MSNVRLLAFDVRSKAGLRQALPGYVAPLGETARGGIS